MDSLFIPSQLPNYQVVPGGSQPVCSAGPAGVTVPERAELAAREGLGAAGTGRTGTWKTRRLGQKERTPLGNL